MSICRMPLFDVEARSSSGFRHFHDSNADHRLRVLAADDYEAGMGKGLRLNHTETRDRFSRRGARGSCLDKQFMRTRH